VTPPRLVETQTSAHFFGRLPWWWWWWWIPFGLSPSITWVTLFGVKLIMDRHVTIPNQDLDLANSTPLLMFKPIGLNKQSWALPGRAGPKDSTGNHRGRDKIEVSFLKRRKQKTPL